MKSFFCAVFLGLILPWILLFTTKKRPIDADPPPTETIEALNAETLTYIDVIGDSGQAQQMEIEEYILGVLIGEMPVDFELEALKAQAVVARTFAIKSMNNHSKHENGEICVDSSCCQEYYDPSKYLADGGTEEDLEKFRDAVMSTKGQVLCYDGNLIEATYFSCSGGKTEDAKAVWGTDVPYLQSVLSPGEEHAVHYMDTVTFTVQEFQKLLGNSLGSVPELWVGKVTYTNGGGVETIVLGNKTYTGTQIRKLLKLNSTSFVITALGNVVTVTTKGFGHRVGMSQYGADAMAVEGKNYRDILSYYYQSTTLEIFENI